MKGAHLFPQSTPEPRIASIQLFRHTYGPIASPDYFFLIDFGII
jgi:hypothetical protein